MCDYSDWVYEKGYQNGYRQAYQYAYQQAYQQAYQEEVRKYAVNTAEKMMKDGILSDEKIAKIAGLSLEEVQQLRNHPKNGSHQS